MDNIIIKDTFEVFIQSLSDPTEIYFLGINSKVDWVKKLSNTILRGGISNLPRSILQTANEMELSVEPLFWANSLIGMSSGTSIKNGTATVKISEQLQINSGEVTLNGTPSGTTCDVFDVNNRHYIGTIDTNIVTVTLPPEDGTLVTVVYPSIVTGDITNLSADIFPKAYKVFAHTIAFSPSKQSVTNDIYINYFQCVPDGNFSATFQAGKQTTLPIKFLLTTPIYSNDFGNYINVLRYTYSIKIDQSSFQGSIGYTEDLTTTVRLNDEVVTDQNIIWVSTDESIGIIFKNAIWENTTTIDDAVQLDDTTNYDNTLDASIFLSSILGNPIGYLDTAKLISKGVVAFEARLENNPQISDGILGIAI